MEISNIHLLGATWAAHSADAFLVGQTFSRSGASGRRIATSDFSVADQSFETGALGPVVDSEALGVGSASGWRGAGRHALGVETRVSHRAVRIGPASDFAHSHGANFATGAVGVLSADGHAHSLAAALVDQTLSVGRT